MNREIRFRAKAVVNDKSIGVKVGDFVYGSFIKTDVDAPCIVWGDGLQMEIDESTLGQFTGLLDKNLKKIWERCLIINHSGRVCLVEWNEFQGCWDSIVVKDPPAGNSVGFKNSEWGNPISGVKVL